MKAHCGPVLMLALSMLAASTVVHAQTSGAESTGQTLAPAKAPADAADKPRLVLTGSFFTRYELRHHYHKLGSIGLRFGELDAFFYRARFGLASTPIDVGKGRTVTLSIAPQSSGFWGPSGGLVDAAVGLYEAKLRIAGAKNWLDLGRFEMIYGDHLVIGNVGWHQTGRTFDGARARVALGERGAWIDGFLTVIEEGTTDGTLTGYGQSDVYFTGVYAALGPRFGEGMDLDGYLLAHIVPESPAGPNTDFTAMELTVGSRVKKALGTITLRAEAGVQFGRRPAADVSVFAFHIDADASIKTGNQLEFIVGALYASGDDPDTDTNEAYNQLYPTAHKFLGFMDIIGGRSNIAGSYVKARFKASEDLGLAADAHVFLRPQTPAGVDTYTGFETDLWALYKLGIGLGLRGQYAIFVPNQTGPFGADDLIHYIEIQLAYRLK